MFFLLSGAINCRAFNRDKGDLGSERGFGAFFEREGQWVYKKRKRFDEAGLLELLLNKPTCGKGYKADTNM